MKLYQHQQKLLDKNPPMHLIAWEVGTGKSLMAMELAKKNNAKTLVVVPKMLREKWERDVEMNDMFADVVTKEEFRRDYKILPRYDAVIIDEGHHAFGSFKSLTHKAMEKYLKVHNVRYRWILTATPYTSSPWSIYSLLKLLDVKMDYWSFRNRFFYERHFGSRVVFEPRTGIEDEIAELVKSAGSVVRMDECADVPEQTYIEEKFKLTKEQKKLIEDVKLLEQNPLARFTKYHQIASGTMLGNEFTDTVRVPALKNDYIKRMMQDNEKVAVWTRYNEHIDLLADICKEENIPYRIIRGDVKDRDAVIQECESARRMVVLINSSCSVGYELPSFGIVIFASLSYSFVEFEQSKGRFQRINKLKKNVYILCITEKSADVPVLESVKRKQNFSDVIYSRERLSEIEP